MVVGGGAGGCSTASKFAGKLGKGQVAVIEPNDVRTFSLSDDFVAFYPFYYFFFQMHYYQPGWTLVGGGIKSVDFTTKPMKDVLPKNADWIKSKVVSFDPDNSRLSTDEGDEISYEYLVIAMGMQLRYEDVSRNSKFGFYKSSSFIIKLCKQK